MTATLKRQTMKNVLIPKWSTTSVLNKYYSSKGGDLQRSMLFEFYVYGKVTLGNGK